MIDLVVSPLKRRWGRWRNPPIAGEVGDFTCWFVNGWASRQKPDPIPLEVYVNGRSEGRVTHWIARSDVEEALGIKAYGFMYEFRQRLSEGDRVTFHDQYGNDFERMRRTYQIPALGEPSDFYGARAAIAAAHLFGRGVEVGAFHMPTDLPPDRDVVFYDRVSGEALREFYDRDAGRPLKEPSLIGEAETLDGLPDAAFDFLVANHVIEHLQDPIRFLKSIAAKLVVGGRAMIAAPDKRNTFDSERALTSFEHLVEDHVRGPEHSQFAHFVEWAEVGLELKDEAARAQARQMAKDTTLFHYHVWDADAFFAFVASALDRFQIPLKMIYSSSTYFDITVVLERTR